MHSFDSIKGIFFQNVAELSKMQRKFAFNYVCRWTWHALIKRIFLAYFQERKRIIGILFRLQIIFFRISRNFLIISFLIQIWCFFSWIGNTLNEYIIVFTFSLMLRNFHSLAAKKKQKMKLKQRKLYLSCQLYFIVSYFLVVLYCGV